MASAARRPPRALTRSSATASSPRRNPRRPRPCPRPWSRRGRPRPCPPRRRPSRSLRRRRRRRPACPRGLCRRPRPSRRTRARARGRQTRRTSRATSRHSRTWPRRISARAIHKASTASLETTPSLRCRPSRKRRDSRKTANAARRRRRRSTRPFTMSRRPRPRPSRAARTSAAVIVTSTASAPRRPRRPTTAEATGGAMEATAEATRPRTMGDEAPCFPAAPPCRALRALQGRAGRELARDRRPAWAHDARAGARARGARGVSGPGPGRGRGVRREPGLSARHRRQRQLVRPLADQHPVAPRVPRARARLDRPHLQRASGARHLPGGRVVEVVDLQRRQAPGVHAGAGSERMSDIDTMRWGDTQAIEFSAGINDPESGTQSATSSQMLNAKWQRPITWRLMVSVAPQVAGVDTASVLTVTVGLFVGVGQANQVVPLDTFEFSATPPLSFDGITRFYANPPVASDGTVVTVTAMAAPVTDPRGIVDIRELLRELHAMALPSRHSDPTDGDGQPRWMPPGFDDGVMRYRR